MSGQLLSSKVVIVEEEPRVRGIPSAPTSVAGAVGLTERGPVGQAVLCSSFDEYQDRFGGFTPDSDLALAAMGFFENGGSQLWVVRTVHYADPSDPLTATAVRAAGFLSASAGPTPAVLTGSAAAPFVLNDGDLIRLAVNGGADINAAFAGAAALVDAATAEPYALADGMTLTVRVDAGAEQAIVLSSADFSDIANASAVEVAAAITAVLTTGQAAAPGGVVRISSEIEGTASRVEVTGGTANAVLQFPTAPAVGTGNVASLAAVTIAEAQAVVEGAIPGVQVAAGGGNVLELRTVATGASASIQSRAATASAFGLDTDPHVGSASGSANAVRVEGKDPGAYANRIEVEVRAATNGSATQFDLLVVEDGVYRESFPNLSMDPDAARYIERVVNAARTGSLYLRVTDQLLAGSPVPPPQTAALAGGSDGLLGLDDADFVGSDAGKTGL
ncbi:MAG: phage tail protein, partial [Polyangiaceae bacterium]|nr:phage tail protein [Polyangiaceae bacterium]